MDRPTLSDVTDCGADITRVGGVNIDVAELHEYDRQAHGGFRPCCRELLGVAFPTLRRKVDARFHTGHA